MNELAAPDVMGERKAVVRGEDLAGIADASPAPLFVLQDLCLRYVNRAFAHLIGSEVADLTGTLAAATIHPDDHVLLLRRAEMLDADEEVARLQIRLRHRDGADVWVHLTTGPFTCDGRPALIATAIDVDEQKYAADAVVKSQRLSAIRRLAGGIAHDFNNLLLVIRGQAERLVHRLAPEDPLHGAAMEIAHATERAEQLTDGLLLFGRRQVLDPEPVDVGRLIVGLRGLLEARVGADVAIGFTAGELVPLVRIDRARLVQVLIHLVDNARDAMADGGTLTLVTDTVRVDEQMRAERPWLRSGAYVRLRVSDTGIGMAAEAAAHLFEPFYTTKPRGIGAGLGLSMVYGVVKQSDGFVWIDSSEGGGTCVTLLLPAAESGTAADAARVRLPEAEHAPERAVPRLLMVEDEDAVRELLIETLTEDGFDVVAVSTAEEAVALADQPFEILLSDVGLPGMSGVELARHFAGLRPDMRILLMSGYAGDDFTGTPKFEGWSFLRKPFSPRAAAARLRELLEE
jgi:two-component system, cell cycle sensor histidine kinase and response regulator CckA